MRALRVLAKLKGLRGTRFDPFGRSEERRTERRLVAEYEALVRELCDGLDYENHGLAVDIASLPEGIRGYGHVKAEHLACVRGAPGGAAGSLARPGRIPSRGLNWAVLTRTTPGLPLPP